ncbi:MAG: D-alanyl-D-alanine dipeptidase [Acaryochloridaceae cyanobacterium SU_2_1]|nr:D-alanyl-D-alanine dipeptidase [Acaryochloridaceae cyanobacterium SU_2_1]
MTVHKPYFNMPIAESGEALVPIPEEWFVLQRPHPYVVLGATYGQDSPIVASERLQALKVAQTQLQQEYPHWQILIFDAYRPVAVQAFMVNYTYAQVLKERQWQAETLTPEQTEEVWQAVYELWAPPSTDPRRPPPHSTGGAVDVTLYDHRTQQSVWMGSEIDELSVRSHPQHFAQLIQDPHIPEAHKAEARKADQHRQILYRAMRQAGFQGHPQEWWHFCHGDQMWAWLTQQEDPQTAVQARYGLAQLVLKGSQDCV